MSFQARIKQGSLVITAEVEPPKGIDLSPVEKGLPYLRRWTHGVSVTDGQGAVMRTSTLALCRVLQEWGLDPILQLAARDRNRLAVQADLLGAGLLGIENVLALTGDHPQGGDHPGAMPVYDLDAVGILEAVASLVQGIDLGGASLKGAPRLFPGAVATPSFQPPGLQALMVEKKLRAGARFFLTQAIYERESFGRFREAIAHLGPVPVLAGILPLRSARMARFLRENIPGIQVPSGLIHRLEQAEDPELLGLMQARELMSALWEQGWCQGFHIMPMGRYHLLEAILPGLFPTAVLDRVGSGTGDKGG